MVKEIISLHIGQAGVQIGNALWRLYAAEHGVSCTGERLYTDLGEMNHSVFFTESKQKAFIPRSFFVDLEPSVIDEIRAGPYRDFYHRDTLITGQEDAANNFARGFFTTSSSVVMSLCDSLQHSIESCDALSGFMIYRSLGGGTGTGLTSTIIDILSDYIKLLKVDIPILPGSKLSSSTVEPYNCILGQHFAMDDVSLSLAMDNGALYNIFKCQEEGFQTNFSDINHLIARAVSSVTCGSRYVPVGMTNDLASLQTNLVPFPRLHHPLTNFAPTCFASTAMYYNNTVKQIVSSVFSPSNQLIECDFKNSKYMSCSLLFRGDAPIDDIYTTLCYIKNRNDVLFVDWVPTGFKVGVYSNYLVKVPQCNLIQDRCSVTMLSNNSAISQTFRRTNSQFQILFKKRCFIHWFVGEGLEECEFVEAGLNLQSLEIDYELCAMETDEIFKDQDSKIF